jgi:pimeloyl-ACP methyl ester carboxylesterase
VQFISAIDTGDFIMTELTMKRVKGDGVEIQLAVWEGEGEDIVCVHGLTANCRCWDEMASCLTPAHTFLAMDLRGRGLSDKPAGGYSIAHHVHDIVGMLDDCGLKQAVLMGHSLGGYIAMAFAANYPERTQKIILIDAGGQLTGEQWDKVDLAIKPSLERLGRVFPSFENYVALLKMAPILQPWTSAIEAYFRYESEEVEGGVRSRIHPDHIQEEIRNLRQAVPSDFYPKVTCPVLILRSTDGILSRDDLVLPETAAEKMVSEMANAQCVDVAGTNHYSIVLQPNEKRDEAILDFLTEL